MGWTDILYSIHRHDASDSYTFYPYPGHYKGTTHLGWWGASILIHVGAFSLVGVQWFGIRIQPEVQKVVMISY